MAGLQQLATTHYRSRVALARRVAREVGVLWGRVDRQNIAASWRQLLPFAAAMLTTGQVAAAAASDTYVDAVAASSGVDAPAEGAVVADALAGVASDGRDLLTLLYQPAVTTLTAIQRGETAQRALASGRLALDLITRTQVADAGRVADSVATVARPALTGYVRMLVGDSCARCVVLAGRRYGWNAGFLRHPRCDCVHVPAAEDTGDDIRTNPRAYFDSLTREQQDKAFTQAGAQAIRDGADLFQVVNSRRGMYTASVGGRSVLATRESTTRRGQYRAKAIRLMPEQIYAEARDDRDEAIRLLKQFRYIL